MDIKFSEENNTNFYLSLKQNFDKITKNFKNEKQTLLYHQYLVNQYIANNPNFRGMLIYHTVGTGKTMLGVSIADLFNKKEPDRQIIILAAKSLQDNFIKDIDKYLDIQYPDNKNKEEYKDNFKFISLNASNMFQQVKKISETKEQKDFEKKMSDFMEKIKDFENLENTLLIIDEAHNLFNSITNGSKNALALYDLIMKTKNIKLIFLTGTPIINHPFELVPCFNMCKGYLKYKNKQVKLFDENPVNFENYFIDDVNIKNKNKFQNRITGLLSYYGKLYLEEKNLDFPEEKKMIVEIIPMSDKQFAEYDRVRDIEREEASRRYKSKHTGRFGISLSDASSSYRVFSRQLSNFWIPPEALTQRERKAPIKHINKLPLNYFDNKNLKIYSPKLLKLMENINNYKNQLGIIYSDFVSGEGLAVIEKALKQRNYAPYEVKGGLSFNYNPLEDIIGGKTDKKYAIISGDIDTEDRTKIIKIFNDKDNIKGNKIQLLLISSTGAEGIDLKNVRHVHIFNPFWNYARLGQIKARAIRYQSHHALPKKDRNVQPYIYLSDYPEYYPKSKRKEKTTDIELYEKSIQNKILIDNFLISIVEASIDCNIHHIKLSNKLKEKIHCRMCEPNNKPLFENLLSKDIELLDPCSNLKEEEVKVSQIKDEDGNIWYYQKNKDKLNIYKYEEELNGYIPMSKSEPNYPFLYKKILKLD